MRRRRELTRNLFAAALAGCALVPLAPAPATAALPGYVRLAHLSPDTSRVDVWVTSFRGRAYSKVLTGVSYGALSSYERLTPGSYTVAMRSSKASEQSPPLIRTNLTVTGGAAYTVAGVGRNAELNLRVIRDDLAQPTAGMAKMRVVQASSLAPVVDVSTGDGRPIALGARFASTSTYYELAAQEWTVRADPAKAGLTSAEKIVHLKRGTLYTALVLDRGSSGVKLVVHADAAGSASTPAGAIDAGRGVPGRDGLPLIALFVGLIVSVPVASAAWSRRGAQV